MPKTKQDKLSRLVNELKIGRGVLQTDGKIVYCNLCGKNVNGETKYLLEQHCESKGHQLKLKAKNEKQPFIATALAQQEPNKKFAENLVKMFLAADIPLHKLRNNHLRSFFGELTDLKVPTETTARRIVPDIYSELLSDVKKSLNNKKIWISVDETIDKQKRYVANVVVRALEKGSRPHLFNVAQLEKTNADTICQTIDDAIRMLGAEFPRENFLVLVTDAAPYMVKAGNCSILQSIF